MSGLNKNRYRNHTISFRVSPTERRDLEARIKASGIKKTLYYIRACLHGRIVVVGSREHIDRLIESIHEMEVVLKMVLEEIEKGESLDVSDKIKELKEEYCSMVRAILEVSDEADKQVDK